MPGLQWLYPESASTLGRADRRRRCRRASTRLSCCSAHGATRPDALTSCGAALDRAATPRAGVGLAAARPSFGRRHARRLGLRAAAALPLLAVRAGGAGEIRTRWRRAGARAAHRRDRRRDRPVGAAAGLKHAHQQPHRGRDRRRRRRQLGPAAPRAGRAAARRHPQLPGGAGRRRVADGPAVPAPLHRRRLAGHSFGNLFLAALAEVTGDFERAVQESTRVLKIRGRVLPSTLEDVRAAGASSRTASGSPARARITAADRLPLRVWLEPETPPPLPQALEAIAEADLVVLGPGSLSHQRRPQPARSPRCCEALRAHAGAASSTSATS